MLLSRASTASQICSKEATYPGQMLIKFSCDFDTFSRGLHNKLVTVLYKFSLWLMYYVGRVETQALPLRQI